MSEYQKKRNGLIEKAESFANKACYDKRNRREGESRTERWNRLYHSEMNRLVKEAGI